MRRILCAVAALATAFLSFGRCHAAGLEYQGQGTAAGQTHLSAEVLFGVESGFLTVQLRNTSAFAVKEPTDVLTGVFFRFNGGPGVTLTKTGGSALIAPGSVLVNHDPVPGDNVGGEWAFRAFGGTPARYGISATGLDDTFGPPDLFDSTPIESPPSPGGVDWGLISSRGLADDANGGVKSRSLIRDSAIFRLVVLGDLLELTPDMISDVQFQYGSSASGPSFGGSLMPEPGSLALLGLASAMLAARRWRRRAAPKEA